MSSEAPSSSSDSQSHSEQSSSSVDPLHPVKLTSSDGTEYTVPYKVISQSVLVKNLIDDVGIGEDDEAIPLPNVDSATFEKVIEWCTHHSDDPEPFVDEFEDEFETARNVVITEWDARFYAVEHEVLFDTLLAANYLDIKLLLDVGCKTVANMMKGKTAEEIREMFGIENDFTPCVA
ncbi:E3 ubiquitin ligase SCF complex, Skp subunit [Cystobasidium minutum MCA 4210]|uniref:E3 ubiquitin ligase SCF complex, Skp subunit n=1 Tax=Cystobasidium minutum MCA 4210 TaxID=1397322 RepID=UPI0034CEE8F0|eukprot:jgi/Rhomi1/201259/MIX2088_10_83